MLWNTTPTVVQSLKDQTPENNAEDKKNKMLGMNGTHLSGGAVALAVGDLLELVAGFGQKLMCFGPSFLGSRKWGQHGMALS